MIFGHIRAYRIKCWLVWSEGKTNWLELCRKLQQERIRVVEQRKDHPNNTVMHGKSCTFQCRLLHSYALCMRLPRHLIFTCLTSGEGSKYTSKSAQVPKKIKKGWLGFPSAWQSSVHQNGGTQKRIVINDDWNSKVNHESSESKSTYQCEHIIRVCVHHVRMSVSLWPNQACQFAKEPSNKSNKDLLLKDFCLLLPAWGLPPTVQCKAKNIFINGGNDWG